MCQQVQRTDVTCTTEFAVGFMSRVEARVPTSSQESQTSMQMVVVVVAAVVFVVVALVS